MMVVLEHSKSMSTQTMNQSGVQPCALTESATYLSSVPSAPSVFSSSLPSFSTAVPRSTASPSRSHSSTHFPLFTALCTYPWPWRRPAPPSPSPRKPSLKQIEDDIIRGAVGETTGSMEIFCPCLREISSCSCFAILLYPDGILLSTICIWCEW